MMLAEDARRVLCAAGLLASAPFGLGAAIASLDRKPQTTDPELGPRAHEALRQLIRHGLLRLARGDNGYWEFTHALASGFARAESTTACGRLGPLCQWAVSALEAGRLRTRKTGEFSPLHNALLHATALLAHDSSGDAGGPLGNWLLYDGQDLFFALGRLASARDSLAAVEAWMQRMPPTRSAEPYWRRELSALLNRKGDVQLAQGDLAGARDSYQNSRAIREKLAAGDPTNAQWQRDLSVSLNKLGDVQLDQGDLAGARDSYQQDLKIAEKLAAGDPTNARWQRDLVVSHAKLGQIASRAGDRTLARDEFAAGLTIVEQLCRLDPTNATWRKDAEWLRGQIGQ
jgi:hypothetical protein